MVTIEEAAMVTSSIAFVIAVTVTVNLWPLGNIFIVLMKIQLLVFLVQSGSSEFFLSDLLWARLGSIIAPTLLLKKTIVLLKQTLLSPNMMTLPLRKKFASSPDPPCNSKGKEASDKTPDDLQWEYVYCS